ncbi:MAG: S9 family peptidase, partial [Saprospiraceae bacterium]|nr:S9 family peptidase [Saprospiraceae bacterium]
MRRFIIGIFTLCTASLACAQALHVPTFEEVISLRSVSSPQISPDGRHVLFSLNTTDWENNRYDSEIWISKDSGDPFPLTNTSDGRSFDAKWSPDGTWIAFKASRDASTQIHAIRLAGGEAQPVTQVEGSIGQYDWSPDGTRIAFTMTPKEGKEDKERKERFGAYAIDDEEYQLAGLYMIDFLPDARQPSELPCHEESDSLQEINCIQLPEPEALIDSVDFTVQGFLWSPDGTRMLINRRPDPLINSFFKADIAMLDVETGALTDLVTHPSYDAAVEWSPDGSRILYQSAVDNLDSVYYSNNRLFMIPVAGGQAREVGAAFDENISVVDWTPTGIYFTAWQKTDRALYRLDPQNGAITNVLSEPDRIFGVSISDDGRSAAIQGRSDVSLNEIYRCDLASQDLVQITRASDAIAGWKVSHSEVISWTSQDGAEIEGVLHKPAD